MDDGVSPFLMIPYPECKPQEHRPFKLSSTDSQATGKEHKIANRKNYFDIFD